MMKQAIILVAAIAAFFAGARAETLRDALELAYRTNPTIRAERANLRAVEEGRAQAIADILPQINGTASAERVDTTITSLFGVDPSDPNAAPLVTDSTFSPLTAGVNAEQRVFSGFREFNAIKQASARIRAGGAQLAAVEQRVLSEAATAFFDVQLAEDVFALNRNNVSVLMEQQRLADLRFEVGEITRTDVAQANARLSAAQADLTTARGDLAVARAAYRRIIGQSPAELEAASALPPTPQTLENAQAAARRIAPDIVAAREQSEASRRQVAIAKGALLPSVSLVAGYQFADEPSNFILESEEFTFGARATIPLFQGGAEYSRIREARARHDGDRARIDEAERRTAEAVEAAWERLAAARAVIEATTAAVGANRLALDGVKREAELGARTTLDVLDAEQELLNAEVALARAERNERAAVFALLAAVGALTPEIVGIVGTDAAPAAFD